MQDNGFVGPIDWAAIQSDDLWEEEGRQEIISEEALCSQLGLTDETLREEMDREEMEGDDPSIDHYIPDKVPFETRVKFDPKNPEVRLGSLFPSMMEFRLAMRQYALNKEFELKVGKSDRTRYMAYCRGGNGKCPWRIYAKIEQSGSPTIIVVSINHMHTCTSSAKRRTTMPSKAWVAKKALPVLMKKPHMGAKDL